MKLYALLAAFAAISATHAIGEEFLKDSIDKATKSLEEFKGVGLKNAEDNIKNLFNFQQKSADDLAQASVKNLAEALKAAKMKGKDIAQCEKLLNSETEAALNKQLADITKCFEANRLNYTTFASEIDSLLEKGDQLQMKIDNIVGECENATIPLMCTLVQLLPSKFSVKSWKSEGESVKDRQEQTISNAKSKILKCRKKLSDSYETLLKSIRTKTRQCLAKLEQDKTTPSTVPETTMLPSEMTENPSP